MPEEVTLTGLVKRVIYHNSENSYTVVEADCGGESAVIVCYTADLRPGETVRAVGSYVNHATYGPQLVATSVESVPPQGAEAIRQYLVSGAVRGIGKVLADRIVNRFGAASLEVLESSPELLTKVKGITPGKAEQISRRYRDLQGIKKVIEELRAMKLAPYTAVLLYKRYGLAAAKTVRENPYLLCGEEYEADFEEVDAAAVSEYGVDPASALRAKAGLMHVLRHNLGNGHTFLPEDKLLGTAASFLEVDAEVAEGACAELLEDGAVVSEPVAGLDAVFLAPYYEAERSVAMRLLEMAKPTPPIEGLEKLVADIAAGLGIEYADRQKKAITVCLQNGVFILTGGPGTGKTTALRGILAALSRRGETVLCCAPTGRAAKRMSELSGAPASTIHRMLGVTPQSGGIRYKMNAQNPLDAGVVIVDEASMLDVALFDALLKAIRPGARLILVGDANQLPPIGAGNVLRDVMGSGLFATVELKEIFRQAKDSLIVVNAHLINGGDAPEFNARDSDFFFVKCPEREKLPETVADLVARRLPAAYHIDPAGDLQVITPTRKAEYGTASLNAVLQRTLNPPASDKAEFTPMGLGFTLRQGDKVMQNRNNYDLEAVNTETGEVSAGIFNGDIGLVQEVDRMNELLVIRFDDRLVEYPFEVVHQLELAYAVTVHKSQGSEYPVVVFPAYRGMPRLQTRNLLYTAVTRAKQIFVGVGEPEALQFMTANSRVDRRYTALKYMLISLCEENENT
ncbi:MAG TPA: ATP-dependent RecD-like DNA helicase [Candidatus Acidoferrum sp.]|nr:ATP-dependent RecD-like DNA helicase [Candidatus Acidoferrum sp.]